jgi:isoleucyl-tRNA synthetase
MLRATMSSPFYPVDTKQSFPKLEEKILGFWQTSKVFEESLAELDPQTGKPKPLFVFYEGPPTANGKPGIHHVLARAFKDVIPRYKTMRGFRVPRKAGWDCHGLPVEVEVEKRLGLRGKQQIEELGIAEFNRQCRESVFRYIGDWDKLTERIAFWVDTEHPYRTLDNDYIETCWSLLKTLWDRSLLVRDYKVTKHCPRCGTSLAEAEAGQGMKEDVEDPSVFVRLRLLPGQKLPCPPEVTGDGNVSVMIWTTTPWTLPANTAAALSDKASYGCYKIPGDDKRAEEYLILLASQADSVLKGSKAECVAANIVGADLVGLRYQPLFDCHVNLHGQPVDTANAYRTLTDSTVEASEGTGIVHIAPAYGDLEVGRRHDLPVLFSVGLDGLVLPALPKFAGKFFKEADSLIIRDLKERGLLWSSGRIRHSYPFCWRCDTPLLYFAKTSWYIKTTAVRDQLLEQNQRIGWYPEHIRDGRFGDWLRNNVDWAISRERYWGTPLPLWICDGCGDIECIGSIAELSARMGRNVSSDEAFDLHRPYVDSLYWSCTGCQGGNRRRIRDVIDCWFDSGAMPFAQHHYPFEHKDNFSQLFPAAFISEGVDQTRGWFYTLHALGVLLRGGPAFENCIVLGHILDDQGRKMSKRLGNIVDPWTVLNAEGADALRYYLYTASPPGQPRRFSQTLVQKSLRQFLLTLWNCYSFYVTYAEVEFERLGKDEIPTSERPLIDLWILGSLQRLVQSTTAGLERYDITQSARGIADFVDILSNWYVRRCRDRFWSSLDGPGGEVGGAIERDKRAAYQTLHTCLVTVAQLVAPFAPFIAEELWQNLKRRTDPQAPLSVHLSRWPEADSVLLSQTEQLRAEMEVALKVVSLGRAARQDQNLKTRQPLQAALVQVPSATARRAIERFQQEVCEELNVEEVSFAEEGQELVRYTLRPNLPKLGKKLGKRVKLIQDAMAQLSVEQVKQIAMLVLGERPIVMATQEGPIELLSDEILLSAQSAEGLAARTEDGLVVGITTEITPELRDRGIARELVRAIGELRKKAGCKVSDRVTVGYVTSDEIAAAAIQRLNEQICAETLSTLSPSPLTAADTQSTVELDDSTIEITLKR